MHRGSPRELVLRILDAVDDATFCALRLARPRFNLHDDAEIERKRKVPHWAMGDPESLCARGIAGGVHLGLDGGRCFTDDDISCAIRSGRTGVVSLFTFQIPAMIRRARTAAIHSCRVDMVLLVGTLLSHFDIDDVEEAV
ncbi:hypothetical protein pneo_cds_507 [Pandoravirus neocaledonia]|uniref:Uncharacterized protein n=1 Tax=Pandoravirus neocaledonia TaxID=2107708 RepID=A0A2U7UCE2_9VIRU|nr:hypothetical protein pneo_cds_507 [Pandoravirus neocaledonia]AVK76114.1 hypothetical protein pneo_cds_507 [Pandoravirus neocaledonia]